MFFALGGEEIDIEATGLQYLPNKGTKGSKINYRRQRTVQSHRRGLIFD